MRATVPGAISYARKRVSPFLLARPQAAPTVRCMASGRTHVAAAAVGVAGIAWRLHIPIEPTLLALGNATGGSLLTDADVDQRLGKYSMVANSLGPVSRWFCNRVSTVARGHRHLTHTIAATLLLGATVAFGHFVLADFLPWVIHFFAAQWVAAHQDWLAIFSNALPSGVLGAIGAYGMFRAGKRNHPHVAMIVCGLGTGALAWILRSSYPYLPAEAAMFGFGSHWALDCIWGRCPWLFWPLRRRGHFVGAGLNLAETGHFSDKLFGWICVFAFPVLMVLVVMHNGHVSADWADLHAKLPTLPNPRSG